MSYVIYFVYVLCFSVEGLSCLVLSCLVFVLSSVCLSNFCCSTPKTDVKCSPLYVYVTLSKNMLQNPLINTRGRFGAGAGAARGHPFLVGAGAGAYLRFPRPLTPGTYPYLELEMVSFLGNFKTWTEQQ